MNDGGGGDVGGLGGMVWILQGGLGSGTWVGAGLL